MLKKLGGVDQKIQSKVVVDSLKGLSDQEAVEEVARSMAEVSQSYQHIDFSQLPCYLPAQAPEQVTVYEVLEKVRAINNTRSTLPIDLPDRLRKECAIDIAEPMCDIINSCLSNQVFPKMWRREWVSAAPKPNRDLHTCSDLRKLASTSDYSKLYEKFLMKWITEDIWNKIDPQQFAGRKGVGTEHMIVNLVDRILSLLDKPGMTAVIRSSADWSSAFDRTDPTKSVQKMIRLGIRPSLVPILIEFLSDRKMSVKFNQKESKIYNLIGGGPQGSQSGQTAYISASDDNAYHVPQDDRYKYCDDLHMLELVMLADVLVEYDFQQHVASDVGVDQQFIDPQLCLTPHYLETVACWTDENLMVLNEEKSDYQIFSRARQKFAARFFVNNKLINRKFVSKILCVWLEETGSWAKNTAEICKRSYAKLGMLTKLKYAGVSTEDLLQIYSLFIRNSAEYCAVVFHSRLSLKQEKSLENIQSTCLRVILNNNYISYENALLRTGLKTLKQRRQERCLSFSLKCIQHPLSYKAFPKNHDKNHILRNQEVFKVNHAYNNFYRDSAIPYCQRLLNTHMREKQLREDRETNAEERSRRRDPGG